MSYQLVAEGDKADLYNIGQYESQFAETQRGKLTLNTYADIPDAIADGLEATLKAAGVEDCKVVTGSGVLDIYFRKGFPWLVVIVAAIFALLALAILITTWQLFKEVGPVGSNLIILAGFLAVSMVFYTFAKRESPTIRSGIKSGIDYAKREAPNIKREFKRGIAYLGE